MARAQVWPTIGAITHETPGEGEVIVPAIGPAWPRPPKVLRPGTRLDRLHASHSYGFVLLLVFLSFAFTALVPEASWSQACFVLIEASILAAALWTSGLPFGRYAIPLIVLAGLVAAITQAASGSSVTRSSVGVVELAFLIGACGVIGAGVIDQGDVNSQSVLGALSIYVTVGMLFTVLYGVLA